MSFLREPNAEPIPGYRLIEPLGCGGFGEAWKCEAPGGLFKAIKFVFGNLNSLDVDGARAEQELKALNRIKEVRHPFILSMDRIEVVEGELVIVMDLADRNLHDAFEESVAAGLVGIPRDTLLRYIRDAAEALDHMNEKHNLQHLDIKPRNLFLISDRVTVADFGLVKHLERSGASGILGGVTPLYAPPETFSGTISGRSDQYSLAIVYQELLTGQRPFNGKNARLLAQQHMNEEPDLRTLPEGDRPVVARALSKDPAKRFPNCLAFVRALYNARNPSRSEPAGEGGEGGRPKTIADTMENILLEQIPAETGLRPAAREAPEEQSAVSQLGLTVAQPQTGALRPTVVIGFGSFGRRALLELRCRLLDRFGELDKLPLFRFLYLDTDTDAIRASLRGGPEVAFQAHEVLPLPLQPVSHYRRRQLDQLGEWLPREKLYGVPRSLKTQGGRALGRLAFTDNYLRVVHRLRRAVQEACHPDALYQAVTQTGLALRDNVPRVYVIGCASGGGSGYLPDLGYAVRRLLHQMRHTEAPVTALLFCGAPDDPATPRAEQANVYATLTEINHFTDPAIPFSAEYGSDGPRLVDQGPAYDHTYLLTLGHRTPDARRDAMAHLGSYLFHELTTPLGLRLDRCRLKVRPEALPFRSLGTYTIWFPRGLLLRLAAREACLRLLDEWQSPGEPTALAELEAAEARVLADPEFRAEAVTARILEGAGVHLDGPPGEMLTALLAALEDQSQQFIAQDDPGTWARQAVGRVKEWLGTGIQPQVTMATQQRKSRLSRALETAAVQWAQEWDRRLTDAALALMEHPGRRVAVAEAAISQFTQACTEAVTAQEARLTQQAARTQAAAVSLQTALENCLSGGGGFSLFGSRSRRTVRVFLDHLAAYSRQCLAEDVAAAVRQFFVLLRARLDERLRDLGLCRQRLRHMQEALRQEDLGLSSEDEKPLTGLHADLSPSPTPLVSTDSFWEAIRASATTRVILPYRETAKGNPAFAPPNGNHPWKPAPANSRDGDGSNEDLEHAAVRFLNTLTDEHWTLLDQALQDHVLAERGGLFRSCVDGTDLARHLASPLLDQAVTCLGNHLPITDVAQVELAREDEEQDLETRIRTYQGRAAPQLGPAPEKRDSRSLERVGGGGRSSVQVRAAPAAPVKEDTSFLLVPASEAGKKFGEAAQKALPAVHLVNVPGQADLMFCREHDGLTAPDLERILASCRPAYEEVVHVPNASPHARFDIQDWTPLDP